ncbi:c-type cytochrome [Akkermansiaceae bacterium]|nr:c-type cytochrome [Akkermansiaceae bacterium]
MDRPETDDSPKLVTPQAAKAAREKFDKYHRLANQQGDATKGKALFATGLACHKVSDTGGIIGPDLSGAGAMSTEALLHNILTPNAQMESGYYRHDIILKDGSKISGSLVEETTTQLSVQPIGTAVKIVPRGNISQHKITKSSLMPEGLIDHLSDEQITDLFTYIRTLK